MDTNVRRGMFAATIKLSVADGSGDFRVEIDGAADPTGFGEALGFIAAGFLAGTDSPELKAQFFEELLIAFLAYSAGPVNRVSGTIEHHQTEQPCGDN